MVGKSIGHYEILEPLGKGGMGEVYRARDTKLERDVAIKVLPEDLADDPDRLARLQREAKLLAALNHPNIATVHALEGEEGASFLVLELVTGESLEQKLARGPLPVEKALDVSKQIAEALEAAHGAGIIHRDLKPANVLVTPDGRAKVLDFGIAKSMQVDAGVAATAHATNLTVAGTLVGTPSYMSPEQVRGGVIDKRVDIWAFGCLLFETLTARSAFAKETMADTLAAIVDQEPDWNALPNELPPQVRRLIERCLRKDPQRRLRDIGDARIEIEDSRAGDTEASFAIPATPAVETARVNQLKLAIPVALAGVFLGALAVWVTIPSAPTPDVTRFHIEYSRRDLQKSTLIVAISPDGTVVFVRNSQLWRRDPDELEPTPIEGTAGATVPFFSSDGQRLGFQQDGVIKSLSMAGGAPESLGARVPRVFGATWASDGYIYFGQGPDGIWRLSESGAGAPEPVIEMKEGERAYGPQLLPGGEWLLFTLVSGTDWNEAQLVVQSQVTGEPRELGIVGTDARYAATGHIVYSQDGDLVAVPFDVDRREITGGAVTIAENVQQTTRDRVNASILPTGASQYSVSPGGLVYLTAPEEGGRAYPLVLMNREGTVVEELPFPPADFINPRFSPDQRRIVVAITEAGDRQIWIYDLEAGSRRRLTTVGSNFYPVWSHEGDWVYFDSDRNGDRDVWKKRADFTGDAQLVLGGEDRQTPQYISSDGKRLLYGDPFTPDADDISILSLDEQPMSDERAVFLGPEAAMYAEFSPDGRNFVFESTEFGGREIFVQDVATKVSQIISAGVTGAVRPVWSRNSNEIFYATGWDDPRASRRPKIHVVAVTDGVELGFSAPELLFDFTFNPESLGYTFDVTADGQRFLMLGENVGTSAGSRLLVVLNWFEELKRLVPTGGR